MAGKEMDFGLGSELEEDLSAEPEPEPAEDTDAIEMVAAEDVMSAMKAGDAQSFRDALKAFVALCYPE